MIADIILKIARKEDLSTNEMQELVGYFSRSENTPELVNGLFPAGISKIAAVDQITNNLGDQIAGRFIAPQTTTIEPTDTGFTGSFMSALGENFGSVGTFNVGAVALGVLQAGFNTAGKFIWAAGKGILDVLGITLTAGSYPATAYLLWKTDDDSTLVGSIDSFYIAGSLAGIEITGQAKESGKQGEVLLLANDSTATTRAIFHLDTKGVAQLDLTAGSLTTAGAQKFEIDTNTTATNVGNTFFNLVNKITGTAATGSGPFMGAYSQDGSGNNDNIGFFGWKMTDVTNGSEDAIPLLGSIKAGSLLEGQVLVGESHVLRVEEAKDKLTSTPGGAGNVDVGTHYAIVTFVDPIGETDADVTQSTAVVIASSAKTVALSAIPLGKWGTTSRKVYVTAAGATQSDATAYHLLTTIADNSTTTATYNSSDATIASGALIPTSNGTGTRPIWPRTDLIQGLQLLNNTGNTPTVANNSSYATAMIYNLTAAQAADGDEYYAGVVLEAGTYTLYVDGGVGANFGKLDYYFDGVVQTTAQDWYAAANAYTQKSLTVTALTSGYHFLLIKVNGKNASSADYIFRWSQLYFVPSSY